METFVCAECGRTAIARQKKALPRRFCSTGCKNAHHNREWQAAHQDQVRAYRRSPTRMAKNRERSLAFYAANRDTVREVMRGRYQATRSNTPWRTLLMGAKSRAKEKVLPFDLTEEWAADRWTGRCEITGIAFIVGAPRKSPRSFWPSIDRIEAELGYTQDNCRFILHAVNALKGDGTMDDMRKVVDAIVCNYFVKKEPQ
jgi:endogenous inhibitor of DNA gyrase (YacG/DUF329 family)